MSNTGLLAKGNALYLNDTLYGGGGEGSTLLQGKKIAFLGDSITDATLYGQYVQIFGQLSGATITNHAIRGATYGAGGNPNIRLAVQAESLVGDEDIVIMMAGTNDFGYSKRGVVLGDVYSVDANNTIIPTTDTDSTCRGVHDAINAIYAKKPTMQIFIITPPQKGTDTSGENPPRPSGWDRNTEGWDPTDQHYNNQGKYLYEYADAIKKVAQLYGIPVIDQFNNSGINPMIAGMKAEYFNSDGTHPNAKYHRLLAHWLYWNIVNWLRA